MVPKYVFVEHSYDVSSKYFTHQHSRKLHWTTIEIDDCWTDEKTFKFFEAQQVIEAYYTYQKNADGKMVLEVCMFWN